jgi:secretion/DNA translocation related TadE-like protein
MTPLPARHGQRGSASIVLLGVGLALVTMALGGQAVGAAAVARHRAGLAADLGALAGALHVPEGESAACARAKAIVAANQADQVSCVTEGTYLVIEVSVRPVGPAARFGLATARARAGPLPP